MSSATRWGCDRADRRTVLPSEPCPLNTSSRPTSSRAHPPDKTVLTTSRSRSYPGAKIGVLGYNGAGKSTLLRIMAGVDQEYRGEARARARRDRRHARAGAAPGSSPRTSGATSRTGSRRPRRCWTASTSSPRTTPRRPRRSSRTSRARSTPPTPGTSTRSSNTRWTRCACPPADADVSTLSGGERRRVALCRLLLRAAGPAAARRAHEPPRRRVGRLARAAPGRVQGDDRRGHPRPLLPRQRRRLDPRARPRARASPTRATTRRWLEQKQARLAQEDRAEKAARQRTIAAELEWVRTNPKGTRAEVQGAPLALRGAGRRGAQRQARRGPDPHPAGPRLGDVGARRPRTSRKGFGDRLLIEDLSFDLPRGGIVGVIGANGAGKTTLFRMITGRGERPTAARSARRHRQARLRRPVARRAGPREDGLGGDLRGP